MSIRMTTSSKSSESVLTVDIGSNSIRSQMSVIDAGRMCFSEKAVYTTRLADGLKDTGRLSEAAMERSLDVLNAISERKAEKNIPVFCYATSAVRDASNGAAFMCSIGERFGFRTEILTGNQEALFARLGAGVSDGGLIDIGGGSFQISTPDYSESFPLGCIRALDYCGAEETVQLLREKLDPVLDGFLGTLPKFREMRWKAVGGSATTLACLSKDLRGSYSAICAESASLTADALFGLLKQIEDIPLEERKKLPLLSKRADVILGGGYILYRLMRTLSTEEMYFSDKDGLEGYAIHILTDKVLR